jgi:tRNA nucleotidyltransferase (CCA-adding enzyme)
VVGAAADDLLAFHALSEGSDASWTATVASLRERGDPLTRGDLAVSGKDLQALGARGPQVGHVLARLLDRVLDDPSLNRRGTLLALAREML